MTAAVQTSIWEKLDKSIRAAYAAVDEQDFERACAAYHEAINFADSIAPPLDPEEVNRRLKSKKVNAPKKTDPARQSSYQQPIFYPVAPDRHLPEVVSEKELQMVRAIRTMGTRQQLNADFEDASVTYERTAELFQNALGPDNGQTAWCLYAASLLGAVDGRRREHLARRALPIFEHLQAQGDDHLEYYAGCLSTLAVSLVEQGRHDEAFQVCSKAIDVIEQTAASKFDTPPMLTDALTKLVNGGVLYDRLTAACQATGRKPLAVPGFPTRKKQLASLLITIAFFWFVLGSPFVAAAFLALLFVHEMGHFLAARQVGVKVSPPIFTPVGAVIAMLSQPASARDEAYFALAGPVAGTVGALVAFFLGYALGMPDLSTAAKYAFALNLFNLVPLAPMDGGRVCMAITRKMWYLGALMYAGIVLAVFYFAFVPFEGEPPSVQMWGTLPIKLFALYWVGCGAWFDFKERKKMALSTPQYFQIPMRVRLGYALAYCGLATMLACAIMYTA